MKTSPDQVKIATEGGLWGAIAEGGRIAGTVVLNDDVGQFNVGDRHALCWVHAERLVRKLPCNTEYRLSRVEPVVARIWNFYAELSEFGENPCGKRKAQLRALFDDVSRAGTGYASLDGLLSRLAANKDELLRVLDHPKTPLHRNGAKRGIRAHVTRRKISFGTRSEKGRRTCRGLPTSSGAAQRPDACAQIPISCPYYIPSEKNGRLGLAQNG